MDSHRIAHVRRIADGFAVHDLESHLRGTAARACRFAAGFGGDEWAALAGKWHDLGKYSEEFQRYIESASGYEREQAHIENENVPGRVDHSTAGAIHAVKTLGPPGRMLAYLIAGHHAGLPDWEKLEPDTGSGLRERLANIHRYEAAISGKPPDDILAGEAPRFTPPGGREGFSLWARMLFSCLADADFLDTEAFMDEEKRAQRGGWSQLTELRDRFDTHMAQFQREVPDTPVNRLRAEILADCRAAARRTPGIFSLTVPTGGGKTLSGMAFALDHAIAHRQRRIIHVIPYTSIIEQTAAVFRDIFGEAVIEHHSNLDPDRETARSRLAAENWDAPIIVTTSVQLFESLFAARPGRCRKLHNLVGSIIVLDEVQLLPPAFLQPILDVLNLLTQYYGVTLVLSTATQPALGSRKDTFGRTRLRGLEQVSEIVPDPEHLYRKLERVRVHFPENLQRPQEWPAIAERLKQHKSVLAIVNTRRHARELHALMPAGTHHLSALMCGAHRSAVIREIKEKLQAGKPVRVVSTQLVEAGVDMDFPVVYRALAGLDAIAQAAGRCNREGLLEKGDLHVFVPPEAPPPGVLRRAAAKTLSVLATTQEVPLSQANFHRFFELFYDDCDLDKEKINGLLTPERDARDPIRVQFRTAAKKFRIIDDTGVNVLVRYRRFEEDDEVDMLLNILGGEGPSRWLMRKLQRYSVNVSRFHFDRLKDEFLVEEVWPDIWAQAEGAPLYDLTLGLRLGDAEPAAKDLVV